MRFLRYEQREGRSVAVFQVGAAASCHAGEPRPEETVFDRPSLEARLRNMRLAGRPAPVTDAALAGWPERDGGKDRRDPDASLPCC